jgi:hypothetical protein
MFGHGLGCGVTSPAAGIIGQGMFSIQDMIMHAIQSIGPQMARTELQIAARAKDLNGSFAGILPLIAVALSSLRDLVLHNEEPGAKNHRNHAAGAANVSRLGSPTAKWAPG